jgi:NDP-sugar pyrophosphorylase family protein
MIERVLEWLSSHGVTEAVLSLGYRPQAFIEAYPSGESCGVALRYAVEPSPLDTAGAIRFAALEAGIDEAFVVVNGDVLTDLDLTGLVAFHRDRTAEATIALTPVPDPSAFGVVPTDATGRVEAFIEKPPAGEAPTNFINAGTYVLERSVLDRVPPGRRVSIERETFPQLVADGRLYALGSDAAWLDAGTPAAYLKANLAYAQTTAGAGNVVRSVVGVGVELGEGSLVEGSVLMDGAVVGPKARVVGSIVGPGATIGEGATLDELCVIGAGHSVDAGVGLVGARLPQVT